MSMDELTSRRQARDAAETAWFLTEWGRLDTDDRAEVAALVQWLRAEELRHRPAAVVAQLPKERRR